MKITGILFYVISIILFFIGIMMDTSTATSELFGRVNNIGLMQKQTLIIESAGILFLAGVMLFCFGILEESVTKSLQIIYNRMIKGDIAVEELEEEVK